MMRVDKKQNRLWAKRMHISVKCYKALLQALFMIERKLAQFEASQKTQSESGGDQAEQDKPQQLSQIERNPSSGSAPDSDDLPDLDSPSADGLLLSSTQKTNKTTDSIPQHAASDNKLVDDRFIDNLKKIKGL